MELFHAFLCKNLTLCGSGVKTPPVIPSRLCGGSSSGITAFKLRTKFVKNRKSSARANVSPVKDKTIF